MCLWYTLQHLPTSKPIAAIAEPHEKLTFFSFPNLVIHQQILKISLKDFILTSSFVWSKSLFFRIWIIPPPKKRNPVSQQLAHITWWKKKFTSAVTSEVIAMASESIVRTFFLFGWDCFIAAVQLNDKSKPPSNSTLEMRIFI